ncbi:unnamed protein product [Heligmosomoides polygyrus]|uniref:Uncharacterized protein n=1 Tax=Heligmosomoides polygyrus TaxID=6339 RepID=A0A3P7ZMY1_HELPZ|nr:unnamed protein product [Heligmosomoides polygyrus]
MASFIKKSIYGLAAVEVAAFGGAFLGFYALRRSEKSRCYLYQHFPALSKAYYWAEDSISFGQLTYSDVRNVMMIVALAGTILANQLYDKWRAEQPLPDIPIQSWDKYVKIQKESGREI